MRKCPEGGGGGRTLGWANDLATIKPTISPLTLYPSLIGLASLFRSQGAGLLGLPLAGPPGGLRDLRGMAGDTHGQRLRTQATRFPI